MKQIYKIVWVGWAINVFTYVILRVAIGVLGAHYSALSYREQALVDTLSILNVVMLIFILLELVNLFVIINVPRYAKISSFIVSSLFPLGAVYFIGCLLSIQRVALSPFSEYPNDNVAPDPAVYSGGFVLTPTALSKTIFLPYECIKRVEERENSVLIAVNLNKKIDIVCSKNFIDREALINVIERLSQAASNNQNQNDNIIILEM
ncbi:hypothetical protein [Photorhabdus khanii]|uniref:Uncharacterized protein n=1 Tax=Photorhabdus khanii subsp. guanajuatensis TaxID=2100166 RepID=A0A4V2X4G4_9GAMM|nr:hypothetical protein [Photorhabdus khanii]TDB44165.1 hypothetical protein C5467_22875 [Photorhabdus khanii subsp. guanajuatensis]